MRDDLANGRVRAWFPARAWMSVSRYFLPAVVAACRFHHYITPVTVTCRVGYRYRIPLHSVYLNRTIKTLITLVFRTDLPVVVYFM